MQPPSPQRTPLRLLKRYVNVLAARRRSCCISLETHLPKSEQNFTVSTGEHMYIESDNLARVNKVTQRTKRKLYAEQDILQTHVFCSCLNINQSAGNISKGNRNTAKRKENGLSYSLFKTRRVSRKMQHDRLQASTLTVP